MSTKILQEIGQKQNLVTSSLTYLGLKKKKFKCCHIVSVATY